MPILRTQIWLIAIVLSILLSSYSALAEDIKNFHSNIYIKKDGTILVQENIEYDFGNALRHGIYRDIPYRYSSGLTKYSVRLDVED
ncbi:MAG: DUF2207 domain-containing protein, partial [Thermodesulfobacteriota bacterium]